MSRDDAFEAWRRRALEADILKVAEGGIVKARLKKKSREYVGACPMCGGGGAADGKKKHVPDGFAINPTKRVFNCRRGGVGGDVIAMVMHACGMPFLAACELITGEPPPAQDSVISDETRQKSEQLKLEAEERERRRTKDDNIYRAREIRTVRDIYDHAHPFAGSSAEIYAGIRGLVFPPAPADRAAPIKCVEAMPYHIDKETIVHRGPAMVAPIINAHREFQGLHFTYLDTSREKGKIQIEHDGEPLDAKKSRGSKQGNFVALCGPPAPEMLVLGEAIEKTIAVYMALASTGRDMTSAAFWSACDLGNLSGKAVTTVTHPTKKSDKGRPTKVAGGSPDLTSASIEIPDTVTDLVLLGDSTSDPFTTKLAMSRAAARYERPGRTVRIAWAPEGVDFDDLLREAKDDESATAAAFQQIAGIIDAASPSVVDDFVPDQAAIAEAIRKFGLAELDAAIAIVRSAEGDARALMLQASGPRLGQLAGAGALNEDFARAMIEEAALACGLIRDDGARAVKKAVSEALKLGKKQPRDLSEVRGDAIAALRALHDQRRPREAADHVISPSIEAAEDPPQNPPDASSSFFAVSPAPPAAGGESTTSSQTGETPEATASVGRGGTPRAPDEGGDDLNMRLAFFPLTDLGNAERFRERCRGRLLFNTALATTSPGRQRGWLAWDNKRWSSESGAERVMIAEHETVRSIQQEAEAVADSDDRDADDAEEGARDFVVEEKRDGTKVLYSDKIARWGRTSESAQKLGALSKRGSPYLSVGIGHLDRDKMKINVNNGTLAVSRREDGDYIQFAPHDPANMITKLSPVDYDPTATAPEFQKFLMRVQPKAEMRLFLQQWFGLSLTGDTSAHKLVFLYGKGRNGKSVLVNAVSYVAGDYGQSVPIETFLDQGKTRAGGQATPDLAKLPGVRLLRTSEPEKNAKLAEALIKLVTGGEPMDARHLQGDFFTFDPEFKLTIQGNYKPTLSGTDEGIKSRILLVPFNVTIPKEERDLKLADKLRAEASGILNWMLDGLRSWLDNGLTEPTEITDATAKYFATSDVLGRFLEICTVRETGSRVQSSVLYQVYEAWCKSSGETPWKNRGFSLALDDRGGYERKQSDVVWWLDLKLIKSVNDFVDHEGKPLRFRDDNTTAETDGGDIEI